MVGLRPESKSFPNHLPHFTILFIFSNPKRIAQVKLGLNFKVIYFGCRYKVISSHFCCFLIICSVHKQKFQKDNLNGLTYRFQPIFFSKMLRVLYTQSSFSSTSWLSGSNSFLPCLLLSTTVLVIIKEPSLASIYFNYYF